MIIGTVRPEEAKVFDADQGYHRFTTEDGDKYGSFEVFWAEEGVNDLYNGPGWYWWACFPGCMPDGEPNGPFASSTKARDDAEERG